MMKFFLVFLVFLVSPTALHAGDFFKFHSTNIQLLRGYNFALGPEDRTIITFEHANKFTYGDFFLFTDISLPDGGNTSHYTEAMLRFSLSEISGKKLAFGPIKDLYLATSVEVPKDRSVRFLNGISADLDVPGFVFLKLIAYVRDNPDLEGTTHQFTVVWNRPIKLGPLKLLTEGVADFAGSEGPNNSANQLIIPRLLLDTGDLMFNKPGKLFTGIEYQYWHNKFGIEGVTESVVQLQAKWVF